MAPYYQFCNRLTFLHLLNRAGIPARLLFVYFLGDRFPSTRAVACPAAEGGWLAVLDEMHRHVGWTGGNPLASRVHRLFLPVAPIAT